MGGKLKPLEQITVFGGTGATGLVFVRRALERGLRVRAFVRARGGHGHELPGTVSVLKGDLTIPADVDAAVEGSGAVVCVFGPRPPYQDVFCHAATKTIVDAMRRKAVRRLVCLTGGMIGDYPENRTFLFRLMVSIFNNRLAAVAEDRVGQETEVRKSGLSWTILKPPRLTDGRPRGRWIAGETVRLGLFSSITRGDLAALLIEEAVESRNGNRILFVRN